MNDLKERSNIYIGIDPTAIGHRAFLYSLGFTSEQIEKPLIAIANTWNEILPGSYHLDRVAKAVKRGIQGAGGLGTIFNVMAPCD